jgi:hypothetical protein
VTVRKTRAVRTARWDGGAVALVLALLAGCSSPSIASGTPSASGSSSTASAASSSTAAAGPGVRTPDHVVVAVFENKDLDHVLGAGQAPFFDQLAAGGAAFTDAHGETHPSQGNYVALFSGDTHGVVDDSCPQTIDAPNLAGQLAAAGKSFVGYSESMPSAGYTGCSSGRYARKHNPWVDFPALPASVNQPLTAMPADFAQLPTVSFVIPDLCSDMHDCPVSTGDQWARDHLAAYASWARSHNSLLIVTFDEDEGSQANHIPTIVVGPMVSATRSSQRIDHYTLLRTIEDMYHLTPLGHAAAAQPLDGIWVR